MATTSLRTAVFVLALRFVLASNSTDGNSPTEISFGEASSSGLGRIQLSLVYGAGVCAVFLVLAASDLYYPTTHVSPRQFPVTETEKKALAAPQSRYCLVGRSRLKQQPNSTAVALAVTVPRPPAAKPSSKAPPRPTDVDLL